MHLVIRRVGSSYQLRSTNTRRHGDVKLNPLQGILGQRKYFKDLIRSGILGYFNYNQLQIEKPPGLNILGSFLAMQTSTCRTLDPDL